MSIDWLKFVTALLLLLCPAGLLHAKHVRYRALSRDWHAYWRRTLLLWTTSLDFFRAVAGVWLLKDAVLRLPEAAGLARHGPILVQAAVMITGSALQALICREREAVLAPFTFVVGLVVGFLPPHIGAFALILALVVATGTRAPAAFFPVLAIGTAIWGYLFTQKRLMLELGIAGIAIALPWLLTLLFRRHFVLAHEGRAAKR